jgi:hypothetical protein
VSSSPGDSWCTACVLQSPVPQHSSGPAASVQPQAVGAPLVQDTDEREATDPTIEALKQKGYPDDPRREWWAADIICERCIESDSPAEVIRTSVQTQRQFKTKDHHGANGHVDTVLITSTGKRSSSLPVKQRLLYRRPAPTLAERNHMDQPASMRQ